MDTQNNEMSQSKKYNEIKDQNKPLNNDEIDKLKQVFKNKCCDSFIDAYSRKNYDLFINKKIFEPDDNDTDYIDNLYYLGVYYQFISVNYDLMKKYYLLAIGKENIDSPNNLDFCYAKVEHHSGLEKKYYIMKTEKGNHNAMNNLGHYYQYIERNYDLMKKYYLQAIKKGNVSAMNNLGHYYQRVEINYDLMKKYYLLAIDGGNSDSMYNLGFYYQWAENYDRTTDYYLKAIAIDKGYSDAMHKDIRCRYMGYDLMIKYYLMAIDKGNTIAMNELGFYYQHAERNYDPMKKYYLMGINKGNSDCMHNLGNYYKSIRNYDLMKKYYIMAIHEGRVDTIEIFDRCCIFSSDENILSDEDLQNYFCALIKNNRIDYSYIFCGTYFGIRIIDVFCFNIDNNNLSVKNFKFCLVKILDYINHCELCKHCKPCKLKNIKHFARYINKLRYRIKNKPEYKKCVRELFKNKTSQIFMEYLDFYYYEHLKKIYVPGGKKSIEIKNHFELTAKLQKNNN